MKKTLSIIFLTTTLFCQKAYAAKGCYIKLIDKKDPKTKTVVNSTPVEVQIDYNLIEGWKKITKAMDDKAKKADLPFLKTESGKRKIFIKYGNDIYVTDVFKSPDMITIWKDSTGKVKYKMQTTTWIYNKTAKKITEKEFFSMIKFAKSVIGKYKSDVTKEKAKINKITDLATLEKELKNQNDKIESLKKITGYDKIRFGYESEVKYGLEYRIYKLKAENAEINKKAAVDIIKVEEKKLEEWNKKNVEHLKEIEAEKVSQKEKEEKIKKAKEEQKKLEAQKDAKIKQEKEDVKKQEDELKKLEDYEKKLAEEMKKTEAESDAIEKQTQELEKKEVPAPEVKEEEPPALTEFQESQAAKKAQEEAKKAQETVKKGVKQKTEVKKSFTQDELLRLNLIKRQIEMRPALEPLTNLKDEELIKLDQKKLDDILKKADDFEEQEDIDFIEKKAEELVTKQNSGQSVNLLALMNEQIEKRKKDAQAKKAAKVKNKQFIL